MSARDITMLDPGTRALEKLGRRVRQIEGGSLRGPGASFGLPFQVGDFVFDADLSAHLTVNNGGIPALAVDTLASEAWSSWTSTPRQNAVALGQNLIFANWELFSRLCLVEYDSTIISAGSLGNEIDVLFSGLPTPADSTYRPIGLGVYFDISAAAWYRVNVMLDAGRFRLLRQDATSASNMGVSPSITANFGDILFFQAWYRTA